MTKSSRVLLLAAVLSFGGCSEDPKSSFENYMSGFKERMAAFCVAESKLGTTFGVEGFDYNVHKTNSLVSPFIGSFGYTISAENGGKTGWLSIEVSLALQDGKWVHKGLTFGEEVEGDFDLHMKCLNLVEKFIEKFIEKTLETTVEA